MAKAAEYWRGPVDIFVICYERTSMLEQCLESIRKCTTSIKHRVIMVEGKRSAAEKRNIIFSPLS